MYQQIVNQYIRGLEPIENDCFELVIENELQFEELKLLNKRGFIYIDEQVDIEFDGEDGIRMQGLYNIYYFKKFK